MLSGGPTKDELIAIALDKLHLKEGETFVDIGCGTGSVSLAASKVASYIIAIDERSEAIERARKCFEDAIITHKVTLIAGTAPEALERVDVSMEKAFIGGTKNFKATIEFLLPRCKRLVLNAARIEVAADAIEYMKSAGIYEESLLIAISKGYELKGFTAYRPNNPVFMVFGSC